MSGTDPRGTRSTRRLEGLTREVCEELLATLGALLRGERAAPGSWEPFQPVLHRHRLEGFVYGRLADAGVRDEALPDGFRRAHLANLRRSALHAEEAARVAIAAGGIPFVFVQGMGLLASKAAEPGERRLSDIDVLLAPRDAAAFVAAMARLGYARKSAGRFLSWDFPGHWELAREAEPGLAFGLDVVSGTRLPVSLLVRHVFLQAEAILQRSRMCDGLPVPAPADLLALTALNVEQKDFAWLGPYMDVTRLASRCDERDWRGVVAALAHDGNRGVSGAVLDACRRWFSAPIPDWVVAECHAHRSFAVQGWEDFLLDPLTVASQRALTGHGPGRLPSVSSVLFGLGRRFMALRSWPLRAQVLAELLTEAFPALNEVLYRARSGAAQALARWLVNPAVVGIGWLLVHPAFLLSGGVLYWTRSRRGRPRPPR